jgi:hypothetical protein
MEPIPEDADVPADIVAIIVGSRRPVLFVEGDGASLDSALYRRVYDGFTVVSVGSCDNVIHTVASFAARPQLHHVGCAGLVDADGRTDQEALHLEQMGVYRLPVSEVENLILLPNVFSVLAKELKFDDLTATQKMDSLRVYIFSQASQQIDAICLRYTKRRIDSQMKKIGLTSANIAALDAEFKSSAAAIDASAIFLDIKSRMAVAIASQDYALVLLHFDNKGLLSEAARQLNLQQKALEQFIGRLLRAEGHSALRTALAAVLPRVVARP